MSKINKKLTGLSEETHRALSKFLDILKHQISNSWSYDDSVKLEVESIQGILTKIKNGQAPNKAFCYQPDSSGPLPDRRNAVRDMALAICVRYLNDKQNKKIEDAINEIVEEKGYREGDVHTAYKRFNKLLSTDDALYFFCRERQLEQFVSSENIEQLIGSGEFDDVTSEMDMLSNFGDYLNHKYNYY